MPALDRTLALLHDGIRSGLHLGGQLYVSRGGTTLADVAFGEARPGEAMTPDHLMLWLSSSKPITAVAVAQLWERGALDLDDPVARHIPEFGQRGKGRVTLRHLLTHTGGIRLLDVGWPRTSWEAILEGMCSMKLEPGWVPGHKAGYHHESSWFVLGEVVRRLDGRPLERYAREEVLLPLGMEDCWIGMPADGYRSYGKRLAPVFDTSVSPPRPHPWDTEERVTRTNPGGGGWGPMRQLARLYGALLERGALEGRRVLSPQTVEALAARHRVGLVDQTFRRKLDWGLGVIVNSFHYGDPSVPYGYGPHASPRAFGHSGYRSSTGFADPEHGLGVALAVNGTPSDAEHQVRFDSVLGAIYEDLGLA